ncbi:hypothetical protein [Curtobacterium sp. GD1]|uniref:hypothetical protein n=1 Tax=Curtobacterium sp. GD1 TaxID=2810612 RepID=UPI001E30AECA|nr:hypothetical protein [Curtobacterium sp. GD1]MCC8909467.1 hypothetical protein [Curtobacterium sp. GD1]
MLRLEVIVPEGNPQRSHTLRKSQSLLTEFDDSRVGLQPLWRTDNYFASIDCGLQTIEHIHDPASLQKHRFLVISEFEVALNPIPQPFTACRQVFRSPWSP